MAPRIEFPDRGMGEHVDWALLRVDMAVGMGALSEAVYGHSKLPLRERESARWTIALINNCAVCQGTRAKDAAEVAIDEDFYREVTDWRASEVLTERARGRVRPAVRARPRGDGRRALGAPARRFADDEIVDLTISCGMWLGMGRAMAVIGVEAPEERLLV